MRGDKIMPKVILCKHNLGGKESELVELIKKEVKDAVVETAPCVDQCRACGTGPFAMVEGQCVQGETFEKLVIAIQEKL